MVDETLELFIQQYIQGVTGPEVVFSWQGGEPTLRGLDFFCRVVEFQKKYAKKGRRIEMARRALITCAPACVDFSNMRCQK